MVWIIFLFFLFSVAYAAVIFHYQKHWNRMEEHVATTSAHISISVIIPARNEAANLPALIRSLQDQSYQHFEVIIINDHSTDGTEDILKQMEDSRFRYFNLQDHLQEQTTAYKKKAIEIGIQHATGELLVTTDADCTAGPGWLNALASSQQQTGAACMAAPVRIAPGKSILSVFQSLDFCTLQGITAAAVSSGTHMMCNGANFAYTKNAFDAVNGFSGIDHIPSGDDMLLIQKIHDRYPGKVKYLLSPDAIVTTGAAATWRSFFQQRIRWASKSTDYTDKKILYILMIVYFFSLMFPLAAIIMFLSGKGWGLLLLFVLIKILVEYPFVSSVARFFRLSAIMKYYAFFQPLHILYTVIARWLGKFGSYQWKGRTIKTVPSK